MTQPELQVEEDKQLYGNVLPSRGSAEDVSYVHVDMPMLSIWEKGEVYLKMISVPLIIVAVTFIGFILRFFREIIIPTVLALFLFQISKVVVLRLHRPIIPYFALENVEESEEEKVLLDSSKPTSV